MLALLLRAPVDGDDDRGGAAGGDGRACELSRLPMGPVRAPASFGAVSLGETPLHLVAASGSWAVPDARARVDAARLLLDAGAAPDAVDANGDTPLHTACACDDAALVRVLIAAGASLEWRNHDGLTPRQRVDTARAPVLATELWLRNELGRWRRPG